MRNFYKVTSRNKKGMNIALNTKQKGKKSK